MRTIKGILAAVLLCTALWLATGATAGGPPAIRRWIVAGGGGQAENRELLLRAAVGQSIAGLDHARTVDLCAGFWCADLPGSTLYLPLTLR